MNDILFWGFGVHAWITIVTVLTMFSVILFTKLRADVVFLGAIAILFVTGVLDAKEAFSGLYADHTGVAMNVLATTIPGLFSLCIGVLSIIALRRLLPDRKAPAANIFIVNIVYPLTLCVF